MYLRPKPEDIVGDHQAIRDLDEFEVIRARFPEVLIQQLHTAHPQLSFNELQMRLFANCKNFVSVLGGSAFLASYFGGTNIVYAREGWEVVRCVLELVPPVLRREGSKHAHPSRAFGNRALRVSVVRALFFALDGLSSMAE